MTRNHIMNALLENMAYYLHNAICMRLSVMTTIERERERDSS